MTRFVLLLLVGLLALGHTAPALAQSGDRIEVAQEQKRRTLFDLLFGEDPKPAAPVEQAPRVRAPAATAALPPVKPRIEKAPGATRLAVFGDSLAVDLAKALERLYAEDPNLVVIDQGVGSSGFVRNDYFDWNATIGQQIFADSFDVAVVIIGINDRQELKVNGQNLAPLTEGWTTAYQARVNDFLGQLRAARKPVIWLGLPPMSKGEYSAAISQIGALQRLAAFSGGAEYLDIYDRFLGEDGKYSAFGPDVNGRTPACARMTASISPAPARTSSPSMSARRCGLSIGAARCSWPWSIRCSAPMRPPCCARPIRARGRSGCSKSPARCCRSTACRNGRTSC